MFRHQGKTRTAMHNARIASLLSFVAGMVNVVGFMYMARITTNVTGHFAYFIDNIYAHEWKLSAVYFLYTIFFLAGSFTSSVLIEIISSKKNMNIYTLPTILESLLLIGVVVFAHFTGTEYADGLAFAMLFAMGAQNSFVTRISNAVVRTTHLTGLFTDLGIELSKLIFRDDEKHHATLMTIRLRIYIITFFFLGGIIGATFYTKMGFPALLFAPGVLIGGLLFDDFRFTFIRMRRHYYTFTKSNFKQKGHDDSDDEILE